MPVNDFSVLIGGKAGFGIDRSSLVIAGILNRLGYRLYIYRDYPSLIRGGHTFSIIRASGEKIAAHKNRIDVLLALNQDTIDLHKNKLTDRSVIIYDPDSIKPDTLPAGKAANAVRLAGIAKEENAPEIMRNSCIIGALCKVCGLDWNILDAVFRKNYSSDIDINLKIARRGYDAVEELLKVEPLKQEPLPVFTGNEAVGLGLAKAGLGTYIAYPMTPTSPILHFLAGAAKDLGLKVMHPESEIAVILMALGAAYCGEKAAVGTSGGGFCLMTEGLSLSGMAELPVVIILGQRPGPSTGLPTYSTQTELGFALSAGQGEFLRFIVAPGDAEEAYYWSGVALDIAWKYQIPSIILTDKTLGEGTYSFDKGMIKESAALQPVLWNKKDTYKRYLDSDTGISPLLFAPAKDAVIKVNSYEHDEYGITTEDPVITNKMQEKRFRKEKFINKDLEGYEVVKVYGNAKSKTAIICWGSNKGVCVEAAKDLDVKIIQVLVMSPFPLKQLKAALKGVKNTIAVENNATGQLVKLINLYGLDVDKKVLRYDGRPFSVEELEQKMREAIR